ncbi:hypothetical protein S7711_02466 [Stachybotrys chartarum IBT 7711]|uniref:Uncharacterized protein n=1 Tax=Stachybotrys chartarum (strain CBS 109288 / IBT 7711) TaxID=1280523 RepID=A0A084AQH2_STACB|nr:hypothetical protein S7711_02466 [Stachybotrys chartarum IBT 7711]
MATLASIQENRDSLPSVGSKTPPRSRTTTTPFERTRPRSRIAVVARGRPQIRIATRRSSKPRHRSTPSTTSNPEPLQKDALRHPVGGSEKSKADIDGESGPASNHESDVEPPATSDDAPSSIAKELESFPLPPTTKHPPQAARDATLVSTTIEDADGSQPKEAIVESAEDTLPKKRADECIPASPSGTRELETMSVLQAGDAAIDSPQPPQDGSIDSALVEAISRNIALQLRLASQSELSLPQDELRPGLSESYQQLPSETCSQRRALDRFTRELEKYAQHTGANGKVLDFTPTDTMSAATLRTISALMPFRPEFAAAGLAVTSRDQAQRLPPYYAQRSRGPGMMGDSSPHVPREPFSSSQMDGHGRRYTNPRGDLIASHPPTDGMNDCDYGVPRQILRARHPRAGAPRANRRSRCLPCFPADTDPSTDGGSSQRGPRTRNQGSMAAVTSRMLSQQAPDALGNVALMRSGDITDPLIPSGRPGLYNPARRQTAPDRLRGAYPKDARSATGRRRPSQVLPPFSVPPDIGRGALLPRSSYSGTGFRNRPRFSEPQIPSDSSPRLRRVNDRAHPTAQANRKPVHDPTTQGPAEAKNDATGHPKAGSILLQNIISDSRPPVNCGLGEHGKNLRERTLLQEEVPVPAKPSRPASPISSRLGNQTQATASTQKLMNGRPDVPKRTSSIMGSLRSTHLPRRDRYAARQVSDRDVLRGLNVVASAACDEVVDDYVRHKTGLQIRQFLADLVVLEALCDVNPDEGEDGEQRARRRRTDLKNLKQHVRRTREFQKLPIPVN